MALFDRLVERVEAKALAAAEAMLKNAETVIAEFPDITLQRENDWLVISGRGLMRRWLADVRLRFAFRRLG